MRISEYENLVHNMRILKLLVMVSVITLRKKNYQRRCELRLLDLP